MENDKMKTANDGKTTLLDYTFVLDASGSMSGDIAEVLEETNLQIRELKKLHEETKRPCQVTIVKFDSRYEVLRRAVRIENLQELTSSEYYAGGSTSLFDAFGTAIESADERVGHLVERQEAQALVMVFTDGGENSSQKFTAREVSALFQKFQEKEGWELALIGSDVQSIMDMQRVNLKSSKMRGYRQDEKRQAIRNASESVLHFYAEKDQFFMLDKNVDLKKRK